MEPVDVVRRQGIVFFGLFDREGRVIYMNEALRRALALRDDPSPLTIGDLLGGAGGPAAGAGFLETLPETGAWSGTTRLRAPNGQEIAVYAELSTHRLDGAGTSFTALVAHGLAGPEAPGHPWRGASSPEQERLLAIIEEFPDFVATADAEGRVLFYNRAARRMLGIGEDEDLAGIRIPDTHPARIKDLIMAEALPAAAREGVWTGETSFLSRDGREIPVLQTIMAHKNEHGEVDYFSTIAVDISERKRHEEQLARLATHDPLTGLLNRTGLQAELERRLAGAGRDDVPHVLLYLDLDNLKDVNDSLGHHAGDELLQRFAAALREVFGPKGVAARIGGDEFAVFLPETTLACARSIAAEFLGRLRNEAVVGKEGVIKPTASVGIAVHPEHGRTAQELLVSADLAMYEAKYDGGNRIALFSHDLQVGKEISSRVTWEQRIREALDHDRLLLYRQPILDLHLNRVTAYELLLRMLGPEGKVVGPSAFLHVACRSELMIEIDQWVVRRALAMLQAGDEGAPPVSLAVNVCGRSLTDERFLALLERELSRAPGAASGLVLEITEQVAIENVDRAVRHMRRLQALGCRFALDDFGVGFASFDLLRRLPVDVIKIDGSFIRNLTRSKMDRYLIKSVVDVARALGKQTVAEFVGDEETLNLVRRLGVDYAQGHYLGYPEPVPAPGGGGAEPGRACRPRRSPV